MRNVANSFDNGQASFSGDGGALEIETSIANYEKLYEVLGK
jgi:hypothetical protein